MCHPIRAKLQHFAVSHPVAVIPLQVKSFRRASMHTSWDWRALENRDDLKHNEIGNVEPYQSPDGNLDLSLGEDPQIEEQNRHFGKRQCPQIYQFAEEIDLFNLLARLALPPSPSPSFVTSRADGTNMKHFRNVVWVHVPYIFAQSKVRNCMCCQSDCTLHWPYQAR